MRFTTWFLPVLILVAAAVVPATCQAEAAPALPDKALKTLEQIVQRGVRDRIYPGAVLIVGTPEKTLLAKAVGRLTYDKKSAPMELNTIFDLASCSKPTGTGMAAMLLLEDGRIGLDDLVSSHVPEFAAGKLSGVTVRDLLTHVSGLPSYANFKDVEKQRRKDESHADACIRYYANLKPRYELRTKYVYSCLNMQVMARVNENAAGERQDALLKSRIYDPLGMKDTCYELSAQKKKRCAPTVRKADGSLVVGTIHDPIANYYLSPDHVPGNAGVFSTAPDLARLITMILDEGRWQGRQILKPETIRLMTDNHMPKAVKGRHGLAWDIETTAPYCTPMNDSADTYCLGHTGYTGTLIWFDKKSRLYAIFLTNRVYPDDKSTKPSIADVRRAVIDTVRRNAAPYQDYFASAKDDKESTYTARARQRK